MTTTPMNDLLDVLVETWDRSNVIMIELARILPPASLAVPVGGTATVAQHLGHLHYVRMIEVAENAPEQAGEVPTIEWAAEADPAHLTTALLQSGAIVREAVRGRMLAGRQMDHHYDHPLLMIQHLLWHDGYHLGQIKLALREAGQPLVDAIAGPVSWDLWMDKHPTGSIERVRREATGLRQAP